MTKRRAMTEAEWLASTSPYLMLSYLQQHRNVTRVPGGKRKLLLLRLAFVAPVRHLVTDPRSVRALEVAGRAAEGKAKRVEVAEAFREANRACQEVYDRIASIARGSWEAGGPESRALIRTRDAATAAAWTVAPQGGVRAIHIVQMAAAQLYPPQDPAAGQGLPAVTADVEQQQRTLILDLFGNPFRPATLDPAWSTANVLDLARTVYEEKAFERMPILGDALLDAGCDDEAILAHCRGPGPHFRGCWLVDRILGEA